MATAAHTPSTQVPEVVDIPGICAAVNLCNGEDGANLGESELHDE